ncbi:MAG: cobalamin biosynthesis protein [Paracoccaceae bacterium]
MRVAGFGFRKATPVGSLRAALELAGGNVAALATAEAKVARLAELAAELGVPVIGVAVVEMAAQGVSGSDRVKALYGTGSVAEAAALAAAGQGSRLIVARMTSPDGMAVVAIAEGSGQ